MIGHRVAITPGNQLNGLAMQVAFTLPLCLPVVGAAALYRLDWFFPAFMVIPTRLAPGQTRPRDRP
jgi:hypothetical protein